MSQDVSSKTSPPKTTFWTPTHVFTSAILLRVALLLYGLVQDAYSPLKYTDIDYFVFTDAARFVSRGLSPYRRETYRYTPLLAWLLVPTAWGGTAWFSFGKVLFAAADVLAGWLAYRILRGDGRSSSIDRTGITSSGDSSNTNTVITPSKTITKSSSGSSKPGVLHNMSDERALRFASVWLLNPMPAQISTRGSSEGLLGAMVIGLLWAVLRRRVALAGVLLGLAVHFKIYPFIYAPAIVLYLAPAPPKGKSIFSIEFLRGLLNRDALVLSITSLITFAGLSVAMFQVYGYTFLEHTYLYHVSRIDHRHNFSLYNTLLYASSAAAATAKSAADALSGDGLNAPGLGATGSGAGSALKLESVAFLPQVLLSAVLLPLTLARRDLAGSMLAQTWAFVALNKVCTSQYFLWYLVLLPLYLPRSSLLAKPLRGVPALVLWVAMQVVWLQQGYQLEFLGRSTFVSGLWAAGLGFYIVNMGILGVIVEDVGNSTGIEG